MSRPFTLPEFVSESNAIEGISRTTEAEIAAHLAFLSRPDISVSELETFVQVVAGKPLRDRPGMDVRVGPHVAPRGGPEIRSALIELLYEMGSNPYLSAFEAHRRYETLHPFLDGNGRSGRVLWLHQMGGIENVPLGFLHTWYYQSLQAERPHPTQRATP